MVKPGGTAATLSVKSYSPAERVRGLLQAAQRRPGGASGPDTAGRMRVFLPEKGPEQPDPDFGFCLLVPTRIPPPSVAELWEYLILRGKGRSPTFQMVLSHRWLPGPRSAETQMSLTHLV